MLDAQKKSAEASEKAAAASEKAAEYSKCMAIGTGILAAVTFLMSVASFLHYGEIKKDREKSKILEEIQDVLTPNIRNLTEEIGVIEKNEIFWNGSSSDREFEKGLFKFFYDKAEYPYFFREVIKKLPKLKEKYLFSWSKVPGSNSCRLRKFLKKDHGISWVRNANIRKTEDGTTIIVSYGENSVELTLSNESNKATLKIDDIRIHYLLGKKENGEQKIYKDKFLRHDELYEKINELYSRIEEEVNKPELKNRIKELVDEFNQSIEDCNRIVNGAFDDLEKTVRYNIINKWGVKKRTAFMKPQICFWEKYRDKLLKEFRNSPKIKELDEEIESILSQLEELDEVLKKSFEKVGCGTKLKSTSPPHYLW